MPPLKNLKHEKFAQAAVLAPSAKQAFKISHPHCSDVTAESHGPALVRNGQVRSRIQEILESQGLTDSFLIDHGKQNYLLGDDKSISFKAWRTFLELHGLLNGEDSVKNMQNINIQVLKITAHNGAQSPQVVDTKEDTKQ
jgi:hypothetical protein